MKSEDYTEWLKKPSSKKAEGKKKVIVSQMQTTNKILVEKLNSNIAKGTTDPGVDCFDQ